ERKRVLRRAKEFFASFGYGTQALTGNLRRGFVEDDVPGLDDVAASLEREFPEQFVSYPDPAGRLLELFAEGSPKAMSRDEALETAFAELQRLRDEGGLMLGASEDRGDVFGDDLDDVDPLPFQRRGDSPMTTQTRAQFNRRIERVAQYARSMNLD